MPKGRGRPRYPVTLCILTPEDEPARHATAPVAGYCPHHRPLRMGYLAWHAEADRRERHGLHQTECEGCGRWLWPDEEGTPRRGREPRPIHA